MNIDDQKAKFRQVILEKLKGQPQEARRLKSDLISKRLQETPDFKHSKAVMFYVSLSSEVDTLPLLEKELHSKKRCVVVPWVDRRNETLISVEIHDWKKDLVRGAYGILEPRGDLVRSFDLNRLDLVLVPGLAFDREGHRLGRGKGYYDRFLKRLPRHVKRFGLAFDFQLFDAAPVGNLDVPVDRVISNR